MNSCINSAQCRAARALLGWTQEELAERTGVQQRTIARFETDAAVPRTSTTTPLVDAFSSAGIAFLYAKDAEGVVLFSRVWRGRTRR